MRLALMCQGEVLYIAQSHDKNKQIYPGMTASIEDG